MIKGQGSVELPSKLKLPSINKSSSHTHNLHKKHSDLPNI